MSILDIMIGFEPISFFQRPVSLDVCLAFFKQYGDVCQADVVAQAVVSLSIEQR